MYTASVLQTAARHTLTCTAAQAAASLLAADSAPVCRSAQASMSAASANASAMATMLKLPDPMSRPGS